jgi:hypothetical protein
VKAKFGGRDAATLVLAVSGPLMLFSGIAVFVMIPRGVPTPIVAVFLGAATVTALAVLVFLAYDARDRIGDDSGR